MNLRQIKISFFLILTATISSPLLAQESTSTTMSFENCLELIRATAQQLGVAPINIVETSDVRIVRFITIDGSVLVTCSRLDRKIIVTKSQ